MRASSPVLVIDDDPGTREALGVALATHGYRAVLAEDGEAGLAHLRSDLAPGPDPVQGGTASWYGAELQGRRTASGERFDRHAFTAASRTFPIGTRVRVTNLGNGRSAVVRINDSGPFARGRVIDVSRAAAQ